MRLLLWHGYLLADTGSNIYTRELAEAWVRTGNAVTVFCQDPEARTYWRKRDLLDNESLRVVRPEIGPHLPVFVVDRYPDLEGRHVADFGDDELEQYVARNVVAIEAEAARGGADFLFANHAVMGGPVARAVSSRSRLRYGVYVHGSELEYAIRQQARLALFARDALDDADLVFVGSDHVTRVLQDLLGQGPYLERIHRLSAGVDVGGFHPARGSKRELIRLLGEVDYAARSERRPDPGAADAIDRVGSFVLYAGKLTREKGVDLLLRAWRMIAPELGETSLVVVGFGPDRAWLEELAHGLPVTFAGAMTHEQLQRLMPLAQVVVVPSVVPEAFGMIAAEAASSGVLPLVANHSGLAEVAQQLGEAGFTFDGSPEHLAQRLREMLSLSPDQRRRLGATARSVAVEQWSWDGIAQRLLELIPSSS